MKPPGEASFVTSPVTLIFMAATDTPKTLLDLNDFRDEMKSE